MLFILTFLRAETLKNSTVGLWIFFYKLNQNHSREPQTKKASMLQKQQ